MIRSGKDREHAAQMDEQARGKVTVRRRRGLRVSVCKFASFAAEVGDD